MKKLNWCTKAEDHAYMKLRKAQNWEIAKRSKAECWMRDNLRIAGLKFCRQQQWGMRLFDFWNAKLGIAIEVDGPEHNPSYDAYRDEYNFRRSGIVVLRVPNFDVEQSERLIGFIRAETTLKERKTRLGIDGHSKIERRSLVDKPYPPSLLAEYIGRRMNAENCRADALAEKMRVSSAEAFCGA